MELSGWDQWKFLNGVVHALSMLVRVLEIKLETDSVLLNLNLNHNLQINKRKLKLLGNRV